MYCISALRISYRDMDEWSLALLSCKVFMKGYEAGAVVKRAGDPSDYAFIVLGGSCKVLFQYTVKSIFCT